MILLLRRPPVNCKAPHEKIYNTINHRNPLPGHSHKPIPLNKRNREKL